MPKVEKDSLFSYAKKYRLVSKQDFQSVFVHARKFTLKHLIVLYQSNTLGYPRLGLVIAKRYVKTAVLRNRLRRVARESFRQHKEILKGLDIVVRVRFECAAALNKQDLRADIDNLWKKLANLSPSS